MNESLFELNWISVLQNRKDRTKYRSEITPQNPKQNLWYKYMIQHTGKFNELIDEQQSIGFVYIEWEWSKSAQSHTEPVAVGGCNDSNGKIDFHVLYFATAWCNLATQLHPLSLVLADVRFSNRQTTNASFSHHQSRPLHLAFSLIYSRTVSNASKANIYQKLNFSHLIYCCIVMLTTYFTYIAPPFSWPKANNVVKGSLRFSTWKKTKKVTYSYINVQLRKIIDRDDYDRFDLGDLFINLSTICWTFLMCFHTFHQITQFVAIFFKV